MSYVSMTIYNIYSLHGVEEGTHPYTFYKRADCPKYVSYGLLLELKYSCVDILFTSISPPYELLFLKPNYTHRFKMMSCTLEVCP